MRTVELLYVSFLAAACISFLLDLARRVSRKGSCLDENSQTSVTCSFLAATCVSFLLDFKRRPFSCCTLLSLCKPAISTRLAVRSYSMLSVTLSPATAVVCSSRFPYSCAHSTCCTSETSEVVICCGFSSSFTWTPYCSVQDSLLGLALLLSVISDCHAVAVVCSL